MRALRHGCKKAAAQDPGRARRAGQRRKINQKLRSLFIGERQRIGKDQAALRIGVADLD